MSRMVNWLQVREQRMFFFVNRRIHHGILDILFSRLTHMGGATFTIAVALLVAVFGHGNWRLAGLQSCLALALSHVPVAIIKKKYPRLRPYLVLPDAKICKNPLTDHSFPSGHTTAIFSIVIPFAALSFWFGLAIVVVALLVGLSRIYLGLHYPSDVLAGSFLGSAAAVLSVLFVG